MTSFELLLHINCCTFLSGFVLPCQDVFFSVRIFGSLVQMFHSLLGCILLCQDVWFPFRMFHSLLRCILPCPDVWFPFQMFHSLSGCISFLSGCLASMSVPLSGLILPCRHYDILSPCQREFRLVSILFHTVIRGFVSVCLVTMLNGLIFWLSRE